MEFATFAYAWDLVDEGVETVAERLTDIGVTEVNVATNYHATQAFLPRNPVRKTFFTRASSYFHPNPRCYGDLLPVPNETMGDDDWLGQITARIADTDLALNSWTIGCHNSRLGMEAPELTLLTPYHDRLVFGLCPSQPRVRDYLTGLLADLDDRSEFRRIELETFDYFNGRGFGWHHDKFHTRLGTLGEFLFGLCFCEACRSEAVDAGIDHELARAQAVEGLDRLAEGDLPHTIDAAGWFTSNRAAYRYARNRLQTLSELYEDLANSVDGAEIGRYLANGVAPENSWMQGIDVGLISEYVDYFLPLAYGEDREEAVDTVRTVQSMTDGPVHAGVLPAHPLVTDESTLVDIVDGLHEVGVERVSFYNYGLLPERNLDWIATAIGPHV